MDRNTLIGILFIVLIFVGWSAFMQPHNTNEPTNKKQNIVQSQGNSDAIANKISHKTGKTFKLESEFLNLEVSEIGAKPYKVVLKNQKRFDGEPLRIIDGHNNDNNFYFLLEVNGKQVSTDSLNFKLINQSDSSIVLRHEFNKNQYIDFNYVLLQKSYRVNFYATVHGLNNANPIPLKLYWINNIIAQEKNSQYEQTYTTTYYKTLSSDPDYLSETANEADKHINKENLKWVSFKQRFFSSALINDSDSFNNIKIEQQKVDSANIIKHMVFSADLPGINMQQQRYSFWFYFGTNNYKTLEHFNIGLEKQVPLGWGPLRWINRWAVIPFFNFLDSFHLNYGVIIILLTVVVRLVLLPLTYSSYVSQVKMQVLKPEIDAIKAKFGDKDQQKLQQEYMKLYKSAGVNPFGGCIPLLLQIPIVFALFRFLPSAVELRQQSFLWVKDLSTYDAIIKLGFNIPFMGDHISLMCLLMTLSTIMYTWLNNRTSGVTGQMKILGYIMPFLFLGILNSYPAGLNLYYLFSNIITFVQQAFIRAFISQEEIHKKIQANKKKPTNKGKSLFQKKLEELSKQRK